MDLFIRKSWKLKYLFLLSPDTMLMCVKLNYHHRLYGNYIKLTRYIVNFKFFLLTFDFYDKLTLDCLQTLGQMLRNSGFAYSSTSKIISPQRKIIYFEDRIYLKLIHAAGNNIHRLCKYKRLCCLLIIFPRELWRLFFAAFMF